MGLATDRALFSLGAKVNLSRQLEPLRLRASAQVSAFPSQIHSLPQFAKPNGDKERPLLGQPKNHPRPFEPMDMKLSACSGSEAAKAREHREPLQPQDSVGHLASPLLTSNMLQAHWSSPCTSPGSCGLLVTIC